MMDFLVEGNGNGSLDVVSNYVVEEPNLVVPVEPGAKIFLCLYGNTISVVCKTLSLWVDCNGSSITSLVGSNKEALILPRNTNFVYNFSPIKEEATMIEVEGPRYSIPLPIFEGCCKSHYCEKDHNLLGYDYFVYDVCITDSNTLT